MSSQLNNATFITENWVAIEITLKTKKEYSANDAFNLIVDGVFTHSETGQTLTIPAFWYKEDTFKIRFAPTMEGLWNYKIICHDDESLNGEGSVYSVKYMGEYEVYKRGFVKTDGHKYFVYDDGTPFFYLGDTHWSMCKEEFDCAGDRASNINCDSHFKCIVDKRIRQGFNVYQSEPIDFPVKLYEGITESTMEGFIKADRYFKYLADKGMTHANAQFFFAADMHHIMNDKKYIEALSRHWVARYGAYPVMWTLAQECDNDFYYEAFSEGGQTKKWWNHETNPWIDVAVYIHKYDTYHHPLTGHQEGSSNTTVTGVGLEKYDVAGQTLTNISNKGASVFLTDEVTERTGHNWWGAQWKQNVNILPNFVSAKDYWSTSKVSVNYEDRYVNLWTNDFGARARGWISYLNGFFGYGYGCIDLWYYMSTYDMDKDTVMQDGVSTITVEDKSMTWVDAIDLESGYQVAYMKNFFETFEWWKLVPDFDNNKYFKPVKGFDFNGTKNSGGSLYSVATIENDVYVIYLYNTNFFCGTVCGMDANAEYTLRWFNPRTGQFEGENKTVKAGADGNYYLEKPDESDWVLYMEKKEK